MPLQSVDMTPFENASNLRHRRIVETALRRDPAHLDVLRTVRSIGLPDWAIGAGFVRNAVWDLQHGHCKPTPLADVDVLYFAPDRCSAATDHAYEQKLRSARPEWLWSVRNQARMHVRNGDAGYRSTYDAMRYWLEVPTCVAVRLTEHDKIEIIAPYGLNGLIDMVVRPTPRGFEKIEQYRARMRAKRWPETWPRVILTNLE